MPERLKADEMSEDLKQYIEGGEGIFVIRGGEFCPRSMYNRAGYDAYGRRYVCKGNRTHPHWMK